VAHAKRFLFFTLPYPVVCKNVDHKQLLERKRLMLA